MQQSLRSYFTKPGQRQALEAYGEFAKGTAWSVPLKMDLYDLSSAAFTAEDSIAAFEAFTCIYKSLTGYWQVFRPHGADKCWTPRQIFDAMRREFAPFAGKTGSALPGFLACGRHAELSTALTAMASMKPNGGYPHMAVSKFVHFYNPSLFPIYDTMAIWNMVFTTFRADFRSFCADAGLNRRADDAGFLINSMCWGSSLLTGADADFMNGFVDWLHDELPRKQFEKIGRDRLSHLYATAFEFTAIGAAARESMMKNVP